MQEDNFYRPNPNCFAYGRGDHPNPQALQGQTLRLVLSATGAARFEDRTPSRYGTMVANA